MFLPRLRCHPPRQALVSASNAAFATTLPPYVPSQSKGNLTIEPSVGIEPTPHPYHRCVLMPLNTMRAYVKKRQPANSVLHNRIIMLATWIIGPGLSLSCENPAYLAFYFKQLLFVPPNRLERLL